MTDDEYEIDEDRTKVRGQRERERACVGGWCDELCCGRAGGWRAQTTFKLGSQAWRARNRNSKKGEAVGDK